MKPKPQAPCGKVCDNRAPACQITCDRWKSYEAERAEWYEENHLRQEIESIDAEMRMRQHEKITRKKQGRRRRYG